MKKINRLLIKKFTLLNLLVLNLILAEFVAPKMIRANQETTQENLSLPSVNTISPEILAQNINQNLQTGKTIIVNNRTFNASWIQWEKDGKNRIAISDISAVNLLGIDLLNTENVNLQPIKWYGENSRNIFQAEAKFINPYRYLDLTELLTQSGLNFTINEQTLIINRDQAEIKNIVTIDQDNKKEILITLANPTPWQISENYQEAVIMLSAQIDPNLLEKFAPPLPPIEPENNNINNNNNNLVDDTSEIEIEPEKPPLLILEKDNNQVKFKINKPANYGVRITSLQNPYRLKIEVTDTPLKANNILWHQGIRWKKQYIPLNSFNETDKTDKTDYFPVDWLEIDLKNPHLSLLPIYPNNQTIIGTEPLLTTSRNLLVSAAINGGFFNRNNQYPLGAIRNNYNWLSSPILNRGVMAWDDQGNVKFDRLMLEETLKQKNGNSFPILFVNSGYVKAGIARYDHHWGNVYSPLTDNEVIMAVVNNQIIDRYQGESANQQQFTIPNNGYLLVFRSYLTGANQLAIGENIAIESNTNPRDFNRYPYIMGAGPLLLKNNQVVLNAELEGFTEAFIRQKASRSAIAITNQGTIIIAASHNRIGGNGATLEEWAKILQYLGAVDALNLDGGSSTSLYLGGQLIDRSAVTAARVNNGIGLFITPVE
jgi:hypothetical protein